MPTYTRQIVLYKRTHVIYRQWTSAMEDGRQPTIAWLKDLCNKEFHCLKTAWKRLVKFQGLFTLQNTIIGRSVQIITFRAWHSYSSVCVCVCITSPVERVVSRVSASDSYQEKVRHSYRTPPILTFALFLLSISSTNTGSYISSIKTASFHILANSIFTNLPTSDASRQRLSSWQRCQTSPK